MSDNGHVLGSVAFAKAGLVLFEDDVEDPVHPVLDAPVSSHRLRGALG